MTTITANDAKQNFGKVIDEALQEPVSITRHGRPSVVVLSNRDYQAFIESQHTRLKIEISMGFQQIERGEISELSANDIAEKVLQQHLRKSQNAL